MTPGLPDRSGAAVRPLPSRELSPRRIDLVTRSRRAGEQLYLRARNGIGLREYGSLGLHRDTISWEEKKRFAGKRWYQEVIERINPAEYRTAAWHKILAGGVLQAFDIPSPRFYGTASPFNGITCDGQPLRSAADLGALVERLGLERICFKLVAGWSGRGLILASIRSDGERFRRVRIEGEREETTLEDFWDQYIVAHEAPGVTKRQRMFGYLCQEVVAQHPDLALLHPESLNTVRVWMYQLEPGAWEMFGAVLRMGTGTATVDNGVGGGIGAPVNVPHGILGPAVRRGRAGVPLAEFDRHPTTGVPIEGMRLPCWSEVLPLSRRACSAFPFLRFMGLDVAITPGGPIVVEVEADPHTSHQAHLGRGLRPLLMELARTAPGIPRC